MFKKLFWIALLGGGVYYLVQNPPSGMMTRRTTASAQGTTHLFMASALAGSLEGMKRVCKGAAVASCDIAIHRLEESGKAKSYAVETGGAAGQRTSTRGLITGADNAPILAFTLNLEQEGGEWRIYELGMTEGS